MKVLRTVVQVVGIIATIASFIPGPWQPIAMAVAAAASVVSAGLALFAKPPRPSMNGSPTSYRLDPSAPLPYMIGRTQYAGACVKRLTFGSDNKYQLFASVYSVGPIQEIEKFTADRKEVLFGAGDYEANNRYREFMWFKSQLGLCPSPRLAPPPKFEGDFSWPAAKKMSGLAASLWFLKWDKDQKFYTGGPPVPGIVAKGAKVYDPRLDSTYPGGAGTCRALQEDTYVWSETPHLHALTYALGRWQNGKRRFGIGFPVDSIDVAYFVEAANIDEANGWKVGGVVFSNDDKWNTLKLIMQAGGAEPITLGGLLSGMQRAPRVSAATITSDDLVGAASVVATQTHRSRLNGAVPRYRSEAHSWEVVAGDPVRVPEYVVIDGGERTKEIPLELVQNATQARQLATYILTDARELGPIDLTLKLRWVGLRPGDCVTVDIPEMGLNDQKCIVLTRSFDVTTGAVKLSLRTETDSKHAFSLGQAGGEPPLPELSPNDPYGPDNLPPAPTTWTLEPYSLIGASGITPALKFSGLFTSTIAEAVEFSIRPVGELEWTVTHVLGPSTESALTTAVQPGVEYEGRVREVVATVFSEPQMLGPIEAPLNFVDWSSVGGEGAPADYAGSVVSLINVNDPTWIDIAGNGYVVNTTHPQVFFAGVYTANMMTGGARVAARCIGNDATRLLSLQERSKDPTVSDLSFDWGFYQAGDGPLQAIAGANAFAAGLGITADDGTILGVEYDGLHVKYYVDGNLVYTADAPPDMQMRARALSIAHGSGFKELNLMTMTNNNWASIGGVGVPDDGATASENVILNSDLVNDADNWTLDVGINRQIGGAGNPGNYFRSTVHGAYAKANNDAMIPCNPDADYYHDFITRSDAVGGQCAVQIDYFDNANNLVDQTFFFGQVNTANVWQKWTLKYHTAATAVKMRHRAAFSLFSGATFVDMAKYRVSRTQMGATVGGAFGVNLLESAGGAVAALAAFKTALGIAAGITGQAPAATDATVQSGATRNLPTGPWVPGFNYIFGDIFQFAGTSYIVHTAHTSAGEEPDFTKIYSFAQAGVRTDIKFIRSNSAPAAPTDDIATGWFDGIPDGSGTVWMTRANKTELNEVIGVWTTPQAISGFSYRGIYDDNEDYLINQVVTYPGGTYIATVDTSGNPPSGNGQSNAWWDILAPQGAEGTPATPPTPPTSTINLTSGSNINLRSVADANGYTGLSDATYTFKVPNGVTIRGLGNGGRGIDTGTWPEGYSISLTLIVENGGIVDGGGGRGGTGNSGTGGAGGDAIYLQVPMTGGITINAGGIVRRGEGGGGGGGQSYTTLKGNPSTKGGGGGGGGFPNGIGGAGGDGLQYIFGDDSFEDAPGSPGAAGTLAGGGVGGGGFGIAGDGGNGGNTGGAATAGQAATSAGGAAGQPGYAVRKNGKACTVTNNGTMTGTAA